MMMRAKLAIIGIIAAASLTPSQAGEPLPASIVNCTKIPYDQARLSCFDTAIKHAMSEEATPAATGAITLLDVMADPKRFNGKRVTVSGFFLSMSGGGFLYPEQGSMNGIVTDTTNLRVDQRKHVLANCPRGCNVTISGKMTYQYDTQIISADTLTVE